MKANLESVDGTRLLIAVALTPVSATVFEELRWPVKKFGGTTVGQAPAGCPVAGGGGSAEENPRSTMEGPLESVAPRMCRPSSVALITSVGTEALSAGG